MWLFLLEGSIIYRLWEWLLLTRADSADFRAASSRCSVPFSLAREKEKRLRPLLGPGTSDEDVVVSPKMPVSADISDSSASLVGRPLAFCSLSRIPLPLSPVSFSPQAQALSFIV